MIERVCREPTCAARRSVKEGRKACPKCKTPYGRLALGLDRDPRALAEWQDKTRREKSLAGGPDAR